ncbi:hypothetical protein [Microbaculum marinisediminis]|uniref:Thioesterase domain-containing protein n=1 Tax=Microbaculum marinisediminis TaxID=2931392 RepID=A0AAW5QQJ6_9HYPH|nr:hypothetical protein [Microbaculum sp. A6E488]MCT8970245.1 hypothetical protein [Microbaculum sp. A6E488]
MLLGILKSPLPATVLAVGLAFGAVAPLPNTAAAGATQTQPRMAKASDRTGEVYLFRGILNVFSQGMDRLGARLRDQGFQVRVLNHSSWSTVAAEIAARRKDVRNPEPVFLIGHSLGADAVILVAERLKDHEIPVALAVTFDPVHPRPAPANIRRCVNFFQSDNGFGAAIKPGPGFRSALVNMDLKDRRDLGHVSLDKASFLHDKVITEMMRLSRPIRRGSAG